MYTFQTFFKIICALIFIKTVLIADAVKVGKLGSQRRPDRGGTKKNLEKMGNQISDHLKSYKSAQDNILKAKNAWEKEYNDKINKQKAEITKALDDIKAAMKYDNRERANQTDLVMDEISKKRVEAANNLASESAKRDAATEVQKKAEVTLNEAKAALEKADAVFKEADAALKEAEERCRRANDALQKEKALEMDVSDHFEKIRTAQAQIETNEHELKQKMGLQTALESHITSATEHIANLYETKRKHLLFQEIEELVSDTNLSKYKVNIDAVTFRPLVDVWDKIRYIGIKHFGLDEAQILLESKNCQNEAAIKKFINTLARLRKWRHENDEQQGLLLAEHAGKPNGLLTYVVGARCLYDEIYKRIVPKERQALDNMLQDEMRAAEGKSNYDIVGQKLDERVKKQVDELIQEHNIHEHWLMYESSPQPLMKLEQGESSGIANAEPNLEEISQTLMIEPQQQQNDDEEQLDQSGKMKKRFLKKQHNNESEQFNSRQAIPKQLERRNTLSKLLEIPFSQEDAVNQLPQLDLNDEENSKKEI
ncbi:hypothetical protein GPALN_010735 [Globodera pallida]|nr:hypothetical protein GPALN_010735 [Globodera pallida]